MLKLALRTLNNHWVKLDEDISFFIDYPTMEQEQKLQEIIYSDFENGSNQVKYTQHYLKYVIKDWKGIDLKCELVNNELKDDIWWLLVRDLTRASSLFALFRGELEFSDVDKKKLAGQDGSIPKVS